jgi:outer membrane lipoprotein-sorting protein
MRPLPCIQHWGDYDASMNSRPVARLLLTVVLVSAAATARAEDSGAGGLRSLSSAQIVEQMQQHSLAQTGDLKAYKALRHYAVEYRGFTAKMNGKMDVEVNYSAVAGKSLRIISQSGSHLLCEKVLKRAVDSEKEASEDKAATALTEANYRFRLDGSESVAGRPAYILDVEPLRESKFLFRGKIWVDAADFAVVKMETEPAKSPSFWIARTLIHYTSVKTDGFWLPQQVRSETKVRIGGTAVLTIDYGSYEVVQMTALASAGS